MAILNNNPLVGASGNQGGYNINNSLRFRGSSVTAYLNRTPTVAGNRRTFTYSAWVKIGTISTWKKMLSVWTANTDAGYFDFGINNNNTFTIQGWNTAWRISTQVFRDPSAWYHIVVAIDTTQATAANRIKLYVNGNQVTSFSSSSDPTQNYDFLLNSTVATYIGTDSSSIGASNFDGYMTDINFIDGQALEPYYFGNNDANGVWKPIQYKGTYGTNGFYLTFGNTTSTTTLGYDSSPNGNNWTTNNISLTAGTTYDAMTDVPTNTSATVANYCVMNPIGGNSSMTLLNGNLNTSATAYSLHRYGTIGVSSGKYYWEASPTAMSGSGNGMVVGISNDIQESGTTFNGLRGYFSNDGKAYTGTSGATYGATWTTNDIIGVALDLDAGTMVFYKNNVSQGTAFTGLTGEWFPLIRTDATVTSWINFGQRPFSYTPPTGFKALNTYNLPDSTIKKGNLYMDATLYTGNGSTQSITNAASFKPDFLWIKNRNGTQNNYLQNSVVGATNYLVSNNTGAENQYSGFGVSAVTAFTSSGFSVSTDAIGMANSNASTYVGWQWQAGQGSTSSNTSGSITSTVSVNTTAGFSVVTWANTSTNATIGHGLGVAPKMIIAKNRTGTADSWLVYHSALGATKFLRLESTAAEATNIVVWNNTAPTSTVFSIGTGLVTGNFVAYCWAAISGYSAFGSYTGNGSADGPFVFTNLKPRFIMIKRTDSTSNWTILDTAREGYNVDNDPLYPNLSNAEGTTDLADILSNGFKLRSTDTSVNANAGTYIYACFSSNPFKNSTAV